MKIESATIRLNNNVYLPGDSYDCVNKPEVVYRGLAKYMNQLSNGSAVFVNYDLFKTTFMYLYFDIYTSMSDILKESNYKSESRYTLSDTPTKPYTIYAFLLSENTFKLSVINNRTEIIK